MRLKLVWFLFVWSPKFCLLIIHPVDKISECCKRPILLYLKKKLPGTKFSSQIYFHKSHEIRISIDSDVYTRASLVAQMVKHLPTMQETWVRSLGQEYPLEKEMATHSSIHAWKIPWTEEPGGLQSMGSQRVGHD